jgi:ATPase subunit of ABC transporter with duplicated ATPase domains
MIGTTSSDESDCSHQDEPLPLSHILDVSALTVRLGDRDLFRDLTFSVERGSSLAVIGPNGSGKTVLFRTLIGLTPCVGKVRWAPHTRLGYVPQKLGSLIIIPAATARRLAKNLDELFMIAVAVAILATVAGFVAAPLTGQKVGPLIVTAAAVCFGVSLFRRGFVRA